MAYFIVSWLVTFSKEFKPGLGKSADTDFDWYWFLSYARDSTAGSNSGIKDMNCVVDGKEGSTTAPDEKVESAGISWTKRGNVINRLDKGKRIDAVCLAGVGKRTIFGSDKGLRVAGRPIAGLGISGVLDKKVRLNTNCSLGGKRGPSPKLEKGSKGAWQKKHLSSRVG